MSQPLAESAPLRAPLEIEFDYTRSLGPVLSQFMTALADRRILGAQGADGRVHAPPFEYDPVTASPPEELVEVGPAGTSKGTACQAFLSRGYDFVLGVGDDATDEDLFRVLPPSAYSIRVGLTQSYARYNVADQAAALGLVESLAATPPDGPS